MADTFYEVDFKLFYLCFFWLKLAVSIFLCFFKLWLSAVHALEKSNQRVPVSNNFPPSEKLCRSVFSFWELIEKRTKCQDAIIFPSQQTFILLWRRFWMESRRAKALKEIPSQSRTKYHRRAELKYNLIAFVSEMLGHGFATKLKSFQLKLRDEVWEA